MTSDRERWIQLAQAVADGAELDWGREAADSHGARDKRLVAELEFLASLMGAHRELQEESPLPKPRWQSLDILAEIGQGSTSTVYRAHDPQLKRDVALKLRETGATEKALTEARMLARVRHAHVVTVHGAESHEGRFGLWMEYVEGRTLEEWLVENGPLGAGEAVSVGLDLCAALAAVHEANLVHGDIKAQNVMRESGGRIVLMDFSAGHDADHPDATKELRATGTPLFMGPEVLAGGPKTPQSDIYGLGVLLYYLLTRRFPVEADTVDQLRSCHERGKIEQLRDHRPDLPSPLVGSIMRAIAADPAERYATAGEFEGALQAVQDSSEPRSARAGRTRTRLVSALLVVAVAALVWRPWTSTESPLSVGNVEASLWRAGGVTNEPLDNGQSVRLGDHLFLRVTNDEPIYVYVVNFDQEGSAYLLFPLPQAQVSNPLTPGVEHRIPGDPTWQYDSWEVSSTGGEETFLVVAAAARLDRLESSMTQLTAASPDAPIVVDPELMDAVRGVGVLAKTAAPNNAGADQFADVLRELASSPLTRDQLVVYEITLENR